MSIFEYVLKNYTRFYNKQIAVWWGKTLELYTIYEDGKFTTEFLSFICKEEFKSEKCLFGTIIIINS